MSPYLIDSHCHLNYPEFTDITATIEKANLAGVREFLTINCALDEALLLQELASSHECIWNSVGIHPSEAERHVTEMGLDTIESELIRYTNHPKTIAIGETGLDYHYAPTTNRIQQQSFEVHLTVCQKMDLPVIIHTREADDDTIAILKAHPVQGVFHCFSGDKKLAQQALDLGFYLSFSGILTFKKASSIQEALCYCPLERMLVETDSPYLAPEPYRGRPNHPAYVALVAQKIADLKSIPLGTVIAHTYQNFRTVFKKTNRTPR